MDAEADKLVDNCEVLSLKKCRFTGCPHNQHGHGLCKSHCMQRSRGKPLTDLYAKTRRPGSPPRIVCDEAPCHKMGTPCHVFRGSKNKRWGYGQVRFRNTMARVHIYVWELENGPVEEGKILDHQCRVRACCNNDHLREVTYQVNCTENIEGASWQILKAKTHCLRGHEYTEENTLRRKSGSRTCLACKRERNREFKKKLRLARKEVSE